MKKWLIVIILMTLLAGCSNASYDSVEDKVHENTDQIDVSSNNNLLERKIIYTASLTLSCITLSDGIAAVKDNLNSDEWFDVEEVYLQRAYFVARIKSNRIDEYLDLLKVGGTIYNYTKKATDVSIDYYDIQGKIDALNAERDRLIVMYENASINEMITINTRLSIIESEMQRLNKNLSQYDSNIEYSQVTIYLTEDYQPPAEDNFYTQIKNGFKTSWNAFGLFLSWIIMAIILILPFGLLIAVVGSLVLYLIKRRKA